MKISIIGSGHVGFNFGLSLIEKANEVLFIDNNIKRVEELSKKGFNSSNDFSVIENTEICFICVPSPTISTSQDIQFIESVCADLGKILKEKESYHLVTVKSTALPGTCENIKKTLHVPHTKVCGLL